MHLAFEHALAGMIGRMNAAYTPKYNQPYVSIATEPADGAAYRTPTYAPTHRWTFLTLSGGYAEVTIDANRFEFVVEQFMPHHVAVHQAVDMDASAGENLARVMADINRVAKRGSGVAS